MTELIEDAKIARHRRPPSWWQGCVISARSTYKTHRDRGMEWRYIDTVQGETALLASRGGPASPR
jgi:hypothetical protein